MIRSTAPRYVRDRQAHLKASYVEDTQSAIVRDFASTDSTRLLASHALHSEVSVDKHNPTDLIIGVHQAVGGDSDAPTPGDLLCGAMAACLDSTIRIIANGTGILLSHLAVNVTGVVDVRGTLLVDQSVPVAFQEFDIVVDFDAVQALGERQKMRLMQAAEQSCIVIQTIKGNPDLDVSITIV